MLESPSTAYIISSQSKVHDRPGVLTGDSVVPTGLDPRHSDLHTAREDVEALREDH